MCERWGSALLWDVQLWGGGGCWGPGGCFEETVCSRDKRRRMKRSKCLREENHTMNFSQKVLVVSPVQVCPWGRGAQRPVAVGVTG